jgi:hypothetical protein
MFRRRTHMLLIAASLVSAHLAAQAPTPPSIPGTPAGEVVRAWLDAFASADTARIMDYYRRYQPERITEGSVNFRLGSGGFDILSIERNEPRHLEMVVKERKTPQTSHAIIDLMPNGPARIATSSLTPMGPERSHVRAVIPQERSECRDQRSLRIPGTEIPGIITAGTYTRRTAQSSSTCTIRNARSSSSWNTSSTLGW